ncbi:Zinc/cadmium transporter [Entamoeba marina]
MACQIQDNIIIRNSQKNQSKKLYQSLDLSSKQDVDVVSNESNTQKQWYKDSNVYKLTVVLIVNSIFFIAELVMGMYLGSLALIVDSFNMLSDVISQVIGVFAIMIKNKPNSNELTYGFGRAEVVGGLINGVFLVSIAIFIIIESIERFIDVSRIENPLILLSVSLLGLCVNIFGLFILQLNPCKTKKREDLQYIQIDQAPTSPVNESEISETPINDELNRSIHSKLVIFKNFNIFLKNLVVGKDLNMLGVLLHVLGDAFGSFVTIFVAIGVYFCDGNWKYYLDPFGSLIVSLVMVVSAIPLLFSCLQVVMQSVPRELSLIELKKDIMYIRGVLSIHDFHIWQLTRDVRVATIKVEIDETRSPNEITEIVKSLLKERNITLTNVETKTQKLIEHVRTKSVECFF